MFKKIVIPIFGSALFVFFIGFLVVNKQDLVMSVSTYMTAQEEGFGETLDKFCVRSVDDVPRMIFSGRRDFVDIPERESELRWRELMLKRPVVEEMYSAVSSATTLEGKGDLFFVIGLWHGQHNDLQNMWAYWTCGAEKFYDTRSMLKVAQIYYYGVDGLDVAVDKNKALFWLNTALYIDSFQGERASVDVAGVELVRSLAEDKSVDRLYVETAVANFLRQIYEDYDVSGS